MEFEEGEWFYFLSISFFFWNCEVFELGFGSFLIVNCIYNLISYKEDCFVLFFLVWLKLVEYYGVLFNN